jgi:hypothetical protein
MLRMMGLAILLLVITLPALALTEARLLNQSTSGQTVVFNLGFHDGIKEGDFAIVVKQIRSLENRNLRYLPVAKARNVKMNSDSSVWILYKIFDQELLVKGDKFQVLSESYMLRGRKLPEVGRVSVVTQKDQVKEQANLAVNDDKDRLSKLKDNYETMAETHEVKVLTGTDADLIDLEVWNKNQDSRYRSSLYKSPNKDEWRRQLRLSTFEKLVTAYLKRVNDPTFNYDSFYEKQKKSIFAHEFLENGNYGSEYNTFLRRESAKSTADAKLYRSLLEKGERWSEDYSDEDLRNVLNQVSVLQEKDRRILVISKPTRYSFALDYGFYLTNNQTSKDTAYQRDNRYSTEADFEATPFLRHETLERFTINGTFRLNYTAFEANTYNAYLDEYSLSLGANWYPLNAPYVVESPIFFMGTYVRSGYGKAVAPTVNQKGNYTVQATPGFRVGFKYLMRNNFGIRLLLSMETLKIERYQFSNYNSVLPENANLAEGKMGVALAYAF